MNSFSPVFHLHYTSKVQSTQSQCPPSQAVLFFKGATHLLTLNTNQGKKKKKKLLFISASFACACVLALQIFNVYGKVLEGQNAALPFYPVRCFHCQYSKKMKFPKACMYPRSHGSWPFQKSTEPWGLSKASCQRRILGTVCNSLLQKSTSAPTLDISLISIPLWVKMHLVSFTIYIFLI